MSLPILVLAILGLSACAPSPYYVDGVATTPGEIPRDTYGIPVWTAIPPKPEAPAGLPPLPPPLPINEIPGATAGGDGAAGVTP
jgi:hypothetical protein